MGVRGSANRTATFSLSLLFPVLILLMLSITLRSEDMQMASIGSWACE